MDANLGRAVGLAVGIILGLILAVLLVRHSNTNKKVKAEYDERQNRVRGDAYRYAFYTLVTCEVILMILDMAELPLPMDRYLLHFAGMILSIVVLSSICIWKDAYWGINNNRKRYGVVMIVAGLLNALPVVMAALGNGTITLTGDLSFPVLNVIVCIMLLFVGAELLVKHTLEKRAETAED